MDTEQDTTEAEVALDAAPANEGDSGGLLDRFDEMFNEDGEAKEGTEAHYGDEEAPVAEDETAEPAAEDDAESEVEEQPTEEQEQDEEPEATEEPASEEDKDTSYEDETNQHIEEMYDDPNPGRKFREIRNQYKEANERISELEKQLENAHETALDSEEVQQMKLKIDSYADIEERYKAAQDRLAILDYESSDDYKQQFVTPYDKIVDFATTIEQANEIDKGKLVDALRHTNRAEQNKALENILDSYEISRRDEQDINRMANDILELHNKRESIQEGAADRIAQLREMEVSEQAAIKEQQAVEVDNAVKQVFSQYEGKIPGFLTDEGDIKESWTEIQNDALGVDVVTAEDKAHAIFAAAMMPQLVEQVEALQNKLKEKNTLVSRMTKAKPTKQAAPTTSESKPANESETFMDRFNRLDFS